MWGRFSAAKTKRRQFSRLSSSCAAIENLESRALLSAVVVQLAASQDNTIYDVHTGDQANGQGRFIVTGGASGTAAARRGLVAFDIQSAQIPEGSTILDVVLTMNLAQTTGGVAAVAVHPLATNWGEAFSKATGNEVEGATAGAMDATWLFSRYDGIAWATPGGDFGGASATVSAKATGAYEWTGGGLIQDVQGWLDDPYSNFGWLVKSSEEAGNIKSFVSRNSGNVALRPSLEITYEEPLLPGIVEGRKWYDKNANGFRESPGTLELNLHYANGKSYFNSYGGNEYWYQSAGANDWYFLTPNGLLRKWRGDAGKLTGRVVERFDSRVWYSPDTLLGSASKSEEPWMNGFRFELVNSAGTVVATAVSRDMDRNGDGIIEDEAERGWYRFESVQPGSYTVREVVPDGWVQSASVTSPGAAEAYQLDVSLGLTVAGRARENFGGLGERWLKGSEGWYYITPVGDFYRWNGKAVTASSPLTGTWIAAPGISYYRDVSLLHAAQDPTLNVRPGSVVSKIDFGNYRPTIISGRSRLRRIPEWIRSSPDLVLSVPQSPRVKNPIYVWQIMVIDTSASADETITYELEDTGGSTGNVTLVLHGTQSFRVPAKQILRSNRRTANLSALDQGNFRILDTLFSSWRIV